MTTKRLKHTRHYTSWQAAVADCASFPTVPGVFADRQPRPREWGISVEVEKAELYRGTTPTDPHRVDLVLLVTGDPDKVAAWDKEASKLHTAPPMARHSSLDPALKAAQAKARQEQLKK